MENKYQLGKTLKAWRDGEHQFLSLVITEECNLRCSYCYMTGKNSKHVMPREVAFSAIDYFVDRPSQSPSLVLDFIGGEPTMEMDLVVEIANYYKKKMATIGSHPWKYSYMFQLSSNGTLYHSEKVQRFLWENRGHAYPAITIDGTKQKHDMHRVFANGKGSYDVVSNNVKLWVKQYPYGMTKVPIGRDDVP